MVFRLPLLKRQKGGGDAQGNGGGVAGLVIGGGLRAVGKILGGDADFPRAVGLLVQVDVGKVEFGHG